MSIWEQLGPIDDLIAEGARLRADQREDEALAVYVRAWEVAEDLDDDVLRDAASHMMASSSLMLRRSSSGTSCHCAAPTRSTIGPPPTATGC